MKIIIFDVGNVIVEADHSITYRTLEAYGVPSQKARRFFDNSEYKEFSRGNIDGRSFYEALTQKYLEAEFAYEQIVDAHNKHLFGVDNKVIQILSKLPKEKLAFLTDTNEWQTERERELIDLRHYSSRIFRSHEMHMLKTDVSCFPYVVSQLGVKAAEILLVDDSIEKGLMAQGYGLKVHQFKGADGLTDYLTSQGSL